MDRSCTYRFADFHLNTQAHRLTHRGKSVELSERTYQLLLALVQASPELVSKETLMRQLWPDRVVSDAALDRLLSDTRALLRSYGHNQPIIRTAKGMGYSIPEVNIEPRSGSGVNNHKIVALGCLMVLVILTLSLLFLFQKANVEQNQKIESIAILPLDTFGDGQQLRFFADGLAEELIHQLALNPELKVVSRTASFGFRGSNSPLKKIGKTLRVGHILEGSIRQPDDTMRITLQLIRLSDGYHVWSKVYDTPPDKLLQAQQNISTEIAQFFDTRTQHVTLRSKKAQRFHPSERAYKYFLQGAANAGQASPNGRKKAQQAYRKALAIAPDYALVHAGLAANYLVSYQHDRLDWHQIAPVAKQHIDMALTLQPTLASAYAAYGLYELYENNQKQAEKHFKRAIELNPNSLLAVHNLGFLYWQQKNWQKAITQFKQSVMLNPVAPMSNFGLADSLLQTGDLLQAEEQFQECVEYIPRADACKLGLAGLWFTQGKISKAQELVDEVADQLGEDNQYVLHARAWQYLWQQQWQEGLTALEKIITRQHHYGALRNLTLIKLATDQQKLWQQQLDSRLATSKNKSDVLLLLAMNAYYQNNCKQALNYYQQAYDLTTNPQSYLMEHLMGISHKLNRAFCYQQQGDIEKAKILVKTSKTEFNKLIADQQVMPGLNWIKYKTDWLEHSVSKLKAEVFPDWPLTWFIQRDPAYSLIYANQRKYTHLLKAQRLKNNPR